MRRNRSAHRRRVGSVVRPLGQTNHFHAEHVRRFAQRRVSGVRRHDLRLSAASPVGAGPFAGGEDRQEDAFRASGSEDAGGLFVSGEQPLHGAEHLPLHPPNARKDADAQAVFHHEHAERLAQHVFEFIGGVPDVGAVAAVAPVQIAAAHLHHLVADLGPWPASFG